MSENLGTGTIKLQADATGFKAAIADAKQSAGGLGRELGNSTQAGAAKGKAAVDQYISRLRVAADNIGKTASQIKLQELAQRGATQAQLETAAAALKTLDAYKQQQAAARQAAAASNQASAGALAMRNALAGLSVAALGREFIQAADAMTSLNARLALVTASYADFQRAQRQVIAVAQQTRTGLGQTADLFTSLSRSTEALGVSQADVLNVTRTINQALVVSGANAESAAAALVQLGQGFASGTLRGEELNSVLEQAPRLARAIADGMGVTVGQLRELGKAGKLTAEQVFQAIQKGGKAINDEFGRMPLTVGQAMTQSSNAVQILAGAMDGATGSTTALAGAISSAAEFAIELAENIKRARDGATDVGVLAEAFLTVSETAQVLYANVKFVFQGIGRDIGAIAAQLVALGRLDLQGFSAISEAVKADAARARAEVDRVTADILARRPAAADALRRQEDRGWDPMRRPAGGPPAGGGSSAGSGSKADPYAAELKALRERSALLGKEGELEKLNTQIALGKFGKLTEARRLQLQYLAAAIDGAADEAAAQKAIEQARDAATEALTRSSSAALAAVTAYEAGNRSMAEEIELMGASATARAAIENARIESLITSKQQLITERELQGIGDERNQVLEKEIALLRERQQLNSTKALKEVEQQLQETGEKARTTLSASIAEGLLEGFRKGNNLADVFLRELKAQFARTVLQPAIEPIVTGMQGSASAISSGLFGLLKDGLKFLTGGSGSGITSGDMGLADYGIAGWRAAGGPVERGRLYGVNELGPELLKIAGQQYLMMGKDSGTVVPHDQAMRQIGGAGSLAAQMPQVVRVATPVTIINQTSQPVQATTRQSQDGGIEVLLQALVNEVAGGISSGQGPVGKAIEDRYSLRPGFSS